MIRRIRLEEGWLTFILVWALLMIVTVATLNAEFIDGLEYLPLIATLGVVAGLALAKSRFSARAAHLTALIYGLFLVTYLMGTMLPAGMIWQDRIFDLFGRQFVWLRKALAEESSRDGLIFVIHTSAVFWLLGYTAAWYAFRDSRVWRVIVPGALVLLSVIYYYYGPKQLALFLALYALIALLYIARSHLVNQERIWRSAAVRFESEIRFSFLQASLVAGLLALALAWSLPTAQASTAVNNALGSAGVKDFWRGFQDDWTRVFSSLRSYGGVTNDPFGSTLTLGGPRTAGNSLIMDIYVTERLPYVYWQAVTYDQYSGGGWAVTDSNQVLHLPDEGQIAVPYSAARKDIFQTVVNYIPNSSTIHGAPEIVNSDRQIYVTQSAAAGGVMVRTVQSRFVMRQGERYQVHSSISLANATSLRQASQNYPDWITGKYLQLPDDITPETLALAEQLTAGLTNPFDKAIAIRDYLRANVAYNDQIEAPPDGVEPVHYILFERQEAYCNYYASALAVMLRSQGIPARFVSGYTQGEWLQDASVYRVRSNNAHAWTEVFFPGYGWIQFEPTASLPAADRPEGGNPGDAFGAESADEQRDFQELGANDEQDDFERLADLLGVDSEPPAELNLSDGRVSPWQIVLGVSLLAVVLVVAVIAERTNRQVESDVEKSYGRLGRWASWLGVTIRANHTPYERATMLAMAVPEGKDPLRNLTHQFVQQRFSQRQASAEDFDPRLEWKTLRPAMLRETILFQLRRLRPPKKDRLAEKRPLW
jgi:transglutaminase-like putative cysteine protease